jgi:LuxR family maltose regulon positive regulatory protein
MAELTDRERDVLRLLPSQLNQREIGRELYLSRNTVKTHTQSLYRKLGVSSRRAAIARARELHLL